MILGNKKKRFPAHIIYTHSLLPFARRLTRTCGPGLDGPELQEKLFVLLFLLSFLCTEQSSVHIGYFYIRKLSYCSITDKA